MKHLSPKNYLVSLIFVTIFTLTQFTTDSDQTYDISTSIKGGGSNNYSASISGGGSNNHSFEFLGGGSNN